MSNPKPAEIIIPTTEEVNTFGDDIIVVPDAPEPEVTIIPPTRRIIGRTPITNSDGSVRTIPTLSYIPFHEKLTLEASFRIKNTKGRPFLEARRFYTYHRPSNGKFYWDTRNVDDQRAMSLWGPFDTKEHMNEHLFGFFSYDLHDFKREE